VSAVTVEERAGGVRFSVPVQPRASRSEVAGIQQGALKVRLQAPPVDGAANEALVDFLADSLDVPRRMIRIVSGESSRSKVVEALGVSVAAVRLARGLTDADPDRFRRRPARGLAQPLAGAGHKVGAHSVAKPRSWPQAAPCWS
jgi:hypothetical protein